MNGKNYPAIWLTDEARYTEFDTMWCQDRQGEDDVLYINADLVKRLTKSWVYASECGGDLHCYFCGELQVTTEDNNHEPDCPYVEVIKLLECS